MRTIALGIGQWAWLKTAVRCILIWMCISNECRPLQHAASYQRSRRGSSMCATTTRTCQLH
jgi:hypothetical protein